MLRLQWTLISDFLELLCACLEYQSTSFSEDPPCVALLMELPTFLRMDTPHSLSPLKNDITLATVIGLAMGI